VKNLQLNVTYGLEWEGYMKGGDWDKIKTETSTGLDKKRLQEAKGRGKGSEGKTGKGS